MKGRYVLKSMNKLKYHIISNIAVKEPFFVLIGNVEWEDKSQLNQFIEAVCSMAKEGLVTVNTWYLSGVKNKNKTIAPDELFRYVSMRLSKGERLDEVPDGNEFEFELTAKGAKFLETIGNSDIE